MKNLKLIPIVTLPLVLATACGGTSDPLRAELQLPDRREAKVTVTPALEVSSLFDDGLAERIVIDEITINLAEARLLGADPSIPAGGYDLLSRPRIVRAEDGARAAIELAFPDQFLSDDDLAVYLRIDPSNELDQASLIIRGRLFETAVAEGGATALTAGGGATSATDPDIDPADDPEGVGVDCATDPDIDPADCGEMGMRRSGLVTRGRFNPSIDFELRDRGAADLVTQLAHAETLDVVVGIPANRWFTPTVVRSLEQVLDASQGPALGASTDKVRAPHTQRVVVEAADGDRNARNTEACGARLGAADCADDVFLTDVRDGLKVRR